jgi:hypothetical protein
MAQQSNVKEGWEEMSDDRPSHAAILQAARDCMRRAKELGLGEDDAWWLCSQCIRKRLDQIARERRARFTVVQ